ncbi:MAG: DNA polymerase III subunit beta, partial [Chlamydiae bacterium]|nr:DNA polymerase III subunit beta [Chlamydiota bacterium]
MKAVIQRSELVALIGRLQSIVPTKPIIPVLSNVLVEVADGVIVLSATDLTVSMRAAAPAKVFEEGSLTLPAKRFFQLIREMTVSEITIESKTDGVALITAGSSHFRIHGMDKSEFPSFPDLSNAENFRIQGKRLKELFAKTSFACARDDSRQVLGGVYVEIENEKITLVGTDGKRLAKTHDEISFHTAEKISMIVPLKAVEEMTRLLDVDEAVNVRLMHDKISIEFEGTTVVSKLLVGQFPDFRRVIPKQDAMQSISVHREELISLLKQVALFTSEVSHSVRLVFDKGELKLQAANSDIGEGRVHMPVDYSNDRLE